MRIFLYEYIGDDVRLDKTSHLILRGEIVGTLRDASNILSPIITFITSSTGNNDVVTSDNDSITAQGEDVVISSSDPMINDANLLSCNYAYIPEFHRYYFITEITSLHNKVWQVAMRVDVLMSYKDAIFDLECLVSRNEYRFVREIEDTLMSYRYDKEITEYIPEKGDKVNKVFDTAPTGFNIVVTTVSKFDGGIGASTMSPDSSLPNIHTMNFALNTDLYYAVKYDGLAALARFVLSNELDSGQQTKYASYIKSIVAYPFSFSQTSEIQYPPSPNISIADKQQTFDHDYFCPLYQSGMSKYLVIADFTISSNRGYLDYGNYAQYEIFLPYCGWITLNGEDIINKRLLVYYSVSYQDGSSSVYIHDITSDKIIYNGRCQLGVKLGLTSDNSRELAAQSNANQLSMGITTLSSALSIAAGVATQNPIAIGGGVIALAGGIGQYSVKQAAMTQTATASISTGNSGLYTSQEVRVRITRSLPMHDNPTYAKLKGRPLYETYRLRELLGMTVVSDCHVDNMNALPAEKSAIKSILQSGVILRDPS